MTQYTDFPIHLHGHTLDLLMAPFKFSAVSDVKGSGFISDHKIISCVVDFPSVVTPGYGHFVPGHFVPGQFVPGHFVPRLGHFVFKNSKCFIYW